MARGSIEAPVGGWNARDSRDNLPAQDAIELVNLIPREGYLESRGGSSSFYFYLVPGGPAYVDSLIPYDDGTNQHLLEDSHASDLNRVLPSFANLGGTFSESKWQWVQSHGRLILVNGTDAPREYDGSTLSSIASIGGSGLTASNLIDCMAFKGRVLYWEDGGTGFWYPAAGEYTSATMEFFDLAQFVSEGGTLALGFTWTMDGGAGMDDLAVFVFTTGETLVYQGSSPGSVSDWALIGRFKIGEPVARRAHCRVGADHLIVTRDGYELISYSIASGDLVKAKLSDKISGAVESAMKQYAANDFGSNFGWEAHYWPEESLLIINVPKDTTAGRGESEQHVYSMNARAWCKWDLPIRTMAIHAGNLYFGDGSTETGAGNYQADIRECSFNYTSDTTNEGESPITVDSIQVLNFGSGNGGRAQLTGLNFLTTYQSPDSLVVSTASDFNTPSALSPATTDNAASDTTTQSWKIVAQAGYAVTFRMSVAEQGQAWRWYATQFTYKTGGPV